MAKKKGKIEIDRERCKGCHLCVHFCPQECIKVSEDINQTGYYPVECITEKDGEWCCIGCAICATVCPDVAIEVFRE